MPERPRRFTEVIAMLTSIDKDDSGGKSETEESDVLDCQLYSSDEMSDNEKTEQFNDAQPIVDIGDLQTSDTNVEIHSATCYNDDSGSGAVKSSRTNEAARDGTKGEFKELSLEARGRHAAQNVLTEQSGLFFQQTMTRNRCCKIMRFLRFDLRSTKSARLQTDKFAFNSNI